MAAKVYRARQYRFKNDAIYQEARARELGLRGSALRAFDKRRKSDTGRAVQNATWINHEYTTLSDLYEAGADVPKPYAGAENAILMEYLGDEHGAAPQLNRVTLETDFVRPVFQRLMDNVELWLSQNRVHGDLSPHNVLYWQGGVRIIDFPQSVDPRFNSHAQDLLTRDIANVCPVLRVIRAGIERRLPGAQSGAGSVWRALGVRNTWKSI